MANCPVCATPNATHLEPTPNVHRVDCPACSKFISNDETLDLISARITKSTYV